MNKGMILMAAGLCLAGTSAAAQQSPSSAASAEAEAQRMEAAAAAMRQRAAALRQLEAANQALAAAQVPIPADPPEAQPSAPAGGADNQAGASGGAGDGASEGGGGDQGSQAGQTGEQAKPRQGGGGGGGQQFGGLEFGVGISFTLDVGTSDRVSEAEVVNGIVRVKDKNNGVARIMLESHYMFVQNRRGPFGTQAGRWGHGPFVALQPGTDDIIQAIGLGWMIGFRRPVAAGEEDSGQSFNLGLGLVVDPNTRTLGEGIIANQPLPDGETSVRYQEEMQTGILALASFSF